MTGRQTPLAPDEMDRLVACVELIGRTGARSFEVAYDDDRDPVTWSATATYQGTKVFAEGHPGPAIAAEHLAAQLVTGGGCLRCGRPTRLEPLATDPGPYGAACVFTRIGGRYRRSCERPTT